MILTVHNVDNMCQISYCVDLVQIWSLNSDSRRHIVLAILIRFILFFAWFDQWKNYVNTKEKLYANITILA